MQIHISASISKETHAQKCNINQRSQLKSNWKKIVTDYLQPIDHNIVTQGIQYILL